MNVPRPGLQGQRILSIALVSLAVLVALGCGEHRRSDAGFSVEVDTVGGVPVTVNQGGPTEWLISPVLTLGGFGASEESQAFGRINSVVADREGNLYIADVLRDEVLVFSQNGDFLRTIGRQGQGPGEFRNPQSLALLGDTLAVSDRGNLRIGLFDTQGLWIGQWPIPPNLGSLHQTMPNEFWARTMRWAGSRAEHLFVRYLHSGPADTVLARPDPTRDPGEPENSFDCEFSDGSVWTFSIPFGPKIVRAPAPEGHVVESDPVGYRITVFDLQSDTVRIIEYVTPETEVTDWEWGAQEERWREFRQEHPGGSCPSPERPNRKRLIEDVFFDNLGRMWVERVPIQSEAESRFDVFSPGGELLGWLSAPRRVATVPAFVRGGKLYLVTADSLDVHAVNVYRIVDSVGA